MSGMQKIIYSMVLTVMYGVAMERQPVQSHKEDDNRNSQQRALANSFIGSLPSELTRSLTPLFSTPAPDQRTMSALGEIRSRDNRSDAIIEANKNLKSFEQLQRELYGDNPAAEDAGKRKFLDAQMAFLASHPKEQSFYPPNNVSAAVALDTQSVSTFLAKEIEQKIESFKQLPQEEKNKTAIAYMRHFPLPEIMGKLLDEGVEVDAHDPQTKFTLVRYAVEAKSPALLGLLLTQRASPDMADCRLISPLMRAASLGNIELAKLLLEKNCTVHAIDAKGRSALCFAARKGDLEIWLTFLQLNGAHVFKTDESYKNQ